MKTKDLLITGITGTTFMTLFSYLVSLADGENFSEPERLGQLADRLVPKLEKKESQALGWLGHYAVGLLFAMVYITLWQRGRIKPDWKTALWLGSISGLLAVAIWRATFKAHPLPPSLRFDKYYLQLVPAHIVFALFATIGHQIMKK